MTKKTLTTLAIAALLVGGIVYYRRTRKPKQEGAVVASQPTIEDTIREQCMKQVANKRMTQEAKEQFINDCVAQGLASIKA